MKNEFIKKMLLKNMLREGQKTIVLGYSKKKYNFIRNNNKNFFMKNSIDILENCKKIVYKKIIVNLNFISDKEQKRILKNTTIIDNSYYLNNETILDKIDTKKISISKINLLNDILANSFYAFTSLENKKQNAYNIGACQYFEDLTQTCFLSILKNRQLIFYRLDKTIVLPKFIKKRVYNSINKYIQRTQKEYQSTSFEELQNFDTFIKNVEKRPNEQALLLCKLIDQTELTKKQKELLFYIKQTNLNDKDIYNTLGISKQAFYKHIQKIKKHLLDTIKTKKLDFYIDFTTKNANGQKAIEKINVLEIA